MIFIYSTVRKLGSVNFFFILLKSFAPRLHLLDQKYSVISKSVILENILTIQNNSFIFKYILKCYVFLWSKLNFQHHYSISFRNHSDMMICCSRNISDYYQCWNYFFGKPLIFLTFIYFSAVKRLIAINRIQNKSFCLHNIRVCTVYIYYVYINTNTCMYIFKKNMLCLYIKYIYL